MYNWLLYLHWVLLHINTTHLIALLYPKHGHSLERLKQNLHATTKLSPDSRLNRSTACRKIPCDFRKFSDVTSSIWLYVWLYNDWVLLVPVIKLLLATNSNLTSSYSLKNLPCHVGIAFCGVINSTRASRCTPDQKFSFLVSWQLRGGQEILDQIRYPF